MVDIKQIKEDVESILVYSQDYPFDLDATNLMRQWFVNKKAFIELFDGETIVRSKEPIKVQLSDEQRARRFNEFISALDDNGILTADFETFLRDNEKGFFDNRVLEASPSFNIQRGSKLSKSFKRFLPNSETIRWAQDTASRFIQESKIEGYLYLSVDPRDFLTLSENNERWWSCQTLDGDYRAGNLSYMVDRTTVIAYLANDNQEHLKCLPNDMTWNSKKWRMLIHTDRHDNIYYNKQYPYESYELLREIHSMFEKYFKTVFTPPMDIGFKGIQCQWVKGMLFYNQLNAGGRTFDTRDFIDSSDYLGYCDLISSNSYAPVVAVNDSKLMEYRETYAIEHRPYQEEEEQFKEMFAIKVGGPALCPCCGEEVLSRDNSFLCASCIAEKDADEDFYLSCDSCCHKIYDEDEIFWIDNRPYCKECFASIQREEIIDEES